MRYVVRIQQCNEHIHVKQCAHASSVPVVESQLVDQCIRDDLLSGCKGAKPINGSRLAYRLRRRGRGERSAEQLGNNLTRRFTLSAVSLLGGVQHIPVDIESYALASGARASDAE